MTIQLQNGVLGLPCASVEQICVTLANNEVPMTVLYERSKLQDLGTTVFICLGVNTFLQHRKLLENSRVLIVDTSKHLAHHKIPSIKTARPTIRQLCVTHDVASQNRATRHRPKTLLSIKMLESGANSALHKLMSYVYESRLTAKQRKTIFTSISDLRHFDLAEELRSHGNQELANALDNTEVTNLGNAVHEVGKLLQAGSNRIRYARIAKKYKVPAYDLRYVVAALLKFRADELKQNNVRT